MTQFTDTLVAQKIGNTNVSDGAAPAQSESQW